MDERKRELLEGADWDFILPKLLKHALYKLRRRFFYNKSPISGLDITDLAQDQVQEAVVKLWEEEVDWDFERKEIMVLLRGVIDSQISHIFDKAEYLTTERFPTGSIERNNEHMEAEEMLKKANPHEKHSREITPSTPPDPVSILLNKEEQDQDKAAMDSLLERLNGEKELEDTVWCMMAGITKPREIAKEMGVDVKHVYNLQKRLRRIYKDLHDQVRKEKRQ